MTARSLVLAVTYGSRVFYLKHEAATVPEPIKNTEETLWLVAEGGVNSLITVTFAFNDQLRNILFLTSLDSFGMNFGIHYIPATQLLFIGGGKLSAVVNIRTMRTKRITNNSCMFSRFEEINGHVVEFGELDCYLYSLDGNLVDECSVDPPYEYYVAEKEILFRCNVLGERRLCFA